MHQEHAKRHFKEQNISKHEIDNNRCLRTSNNPVKTTRQTTRSGTIHDMHAYNILKIKSQLIKLHFSRYVLRTTNFDDEITQLHFYF